MTTRPRRSAVRSICCALILAVTAQFAAPPSGWASLAPSGIAAEASTSGAVRADDMRTIAAVLESKALRGRLKSLGLDDKEVDSRLRQLSDSEVHQLATQLEAVRPGGIVVELLVVVVLVLLVLFLVKRV